MTAPYTFDVFSSLDGFGGVSGGPLTCTDHADRTRGNHAATAAQPSRRRERSLEPATGEGLE
jgi:hypothetical protein